MKNIMHDWFRWNNTANESFIEALKNARTTPDKYIEIFSRIINEHERWLNRICAVNGLSTEDSHLRPEELAQRNALIHDITAKFLETESYGDNFDWCFTYVENGIADQRTLSEVYFHILTFSEFHRGQLAELLIVNGIDAPATDYISLKAQLN